MLLPNRRLSHAGLPSGIPAAVPAWCSTGRGDGGRSAATEAEESGGDDAEGYVRWVEGEGFVDGFASEREVDGFAG